MDKKEREARSFLSDMTLLLSANNFSSLARFSQNRVWFDCLHLNELHYCTILEWLLSPAEGHGLGSFFLRRLLLAAASEAPNLSSLKDEKQADAPNVLTADQIHTLSLDQAITGRETQISKASEEKGRIDLLIVEPQSRVVVVIERKDGATLSNNQLQKYQNWVEKNFEEYRKLFILSDSRQRNHQSEAFNTWIQLDDAWLVAALKEALLPGRLPFSVQEHLEDLLYHFDTDGEYRDPFHRGIESELKEFALEHSEVIKSLSNNTFSTIDSRSALSKWLVEADKSSSYQMRQAVVLAQRHHTLLQNLMAVQSLEAVRDILVNKCSNQNLQFELFANRMNIGTQEMQDLVDKNVVKCWPITLKLFLPNEPRNQLSDAPETSHITPTLEILMDMQSFGDDRYEEAKSLAEKHGLHARRRWASLTEKFAHKDLISPYQIDKLKARITQMVEIADCWITK